MFTQQPYAHTGRDLFNQLLSAILGSVIPGGEQLAGMASGPLQQWLGIQNDVFMDTVLFSNMTPYGVSRAQDNAILQRLSQSALGSTQQAAQFQAYQGLARTLTSYEAWSRLPVSEQAGSYQAFIDSKAQSFMGNIGFNTAFAMLDPLGLQNMNKYMSMAAANLTRFGLSHGNRNAYINTKKVISDMFRDDAGNYDFDKRDWGYFNNGEVAALTAAITKHYDAVGDADISQAGSLKNASQRLRDKVKSYAEALSPLKDIFGSDIPSMIRSIEELAGQDIATMGPERARAIANMAIDKTSTGRYSMSDLSSWGQQFSTLMRDMDIPVLNKLNGTMYASMALDAVHGGVKPRYMTSSTFMNMAAEQVIRTANSEGADDYAKTYALWAERRRRADGPDADVSFSTFHSELTRVANANFNGNKATAMLEMAGVTNRYDLNQGLTSEYYTSAKESGLGAQLAFDSNMSRTMQHSRYAMMHDLTFRNFVRANTGRQDYTAQDVQTDFNRTMDMLKDSPEILNMRGNEQIFALAEKDSSITAEFNASKYNEWARSQKAGSDTSIGAFMRSLNMDESKIQELQISQMIASQLINNSRYTNLHGMIFMHHNQLRQAKAQQEAADRREYATGLDRWVGGARETFIQSVLNNGRGLDTDEVRRWLAGATELSAIGSPAARAESIAAIEAATIEGTTRFQVTDEVKQRSFADTGIYGINSSSYKQWLNGRTSTDDLWNEWKRLKTVEMETESRNRIYENVRDSITYTNAAAGLGNAGYRQNLARYMSTTNADDKAHYAGLMSTYRYINENAVDTYLSAGAVTSETDTGYVAWKSSQAAGADTSLAAYNNHVRRTREAQLVTALNEGGATGVRARIENEKIDAALTKFGRAQADGSTSNPADQIRRDLVTAFRGAAEAGGFYGKDSTAAFNVDKFNAWIDAQRKSIRAGKKDEDLTDDQRSSLSILEEFAGTVTRSRTGVTAQANPIVDTLNSILRVLNNIFSSMPKPGTPQNT